MLVGDTCVSEAGMVAIVITALAIQRFVPSHRSAKGVDALSDRELTVFSLIAAGPRPGRIATDLGISRKTIETHCEHIKQTLGYASAEEFKRGARDLLGAPNSYSPKKAPDLLIRDIQHTKCGIP
jgi:DNA-binding CsgD family transcriptional regulator